MNIEIAENLKKHVFYHATTQDRAEKIAKEGFRSRMVFDPEYNESYSTTGGCLGSGIYVTCNWKTALFFGNVLLEVGLAKGTRILDVSQPPDKAVLDGLKRKFGHEILRKEPWKVIPKNKQLTLPELVALVSLHYHDRHDYRKKKGTEHWLLLNRCRKLLSRYGYDGFGDPSNDMGIVVFSEERLVFRGVILKCPESLWWGPKGEARFEKYGSLRELRDAIPKEGAWKEKVPEEKR
jgi:hypothetical protein